jgi:AraC-like DNA-binding protein
VPADAPHYRFALNPPWKAIPHASAVVRSGLSGDYHAAPFTTTLSLKSVSRGVATWATRQSRYRVDHRSLVVLNCGQTYTLDIAASDRTGTMALFFEPGLVEEVARALGDGPEALFGEGLASSIEVGMCERLHPKRGKLAQRLAAIEAGIQGGCCDEAWLEEHMLGVAAGLVLLDARTRREMASFPGLRASTRAEAYRRLHHARDFLDASFSEPLSIAVLARVACMSPFHFHRLFKQAFGETPMQRVQRLRIAQAATLLATTDREVTRICFDVGFESLGTFSALFHRRMEVSPRRHREKSRIGEVRERSRR